MTDQERLNTFLAEQKYMTLAVTLDDGRPWAVPVRIKHWAEKVFEWDSKLDAEHSKAIANRPDVAIMMWTPGSTSADQLGFYAQATAELVSEEDGIGRYRATVTKSWINDASFVKRAVDPAA